MSIIRKYALKVTIAALSAVDIRRIGRAYRQRIYRQYGKPWGWFSINKNSDDYEYAVELICFPATEKR